MSQYQASQRSSREHGGACEKLLTLGGCWEMKSQFPLGLWPLVGQPSSSEHMGITH